MSDEPGSEEEPGAVDARRLVADLINAGLIAEPRARDAERHAVRIMDPDGTPAGWFVALVIDERLIGFAQFDEALRFRRYSSFAGREPAAQDWLDSSVVLSQARERSGADIDLGQPFLSFDASPDRIAWLVPAIGHDGARHRIFVAGDKVFERLAGSTGAYTPRTEEHPMLPGEGGEMSKASDPFNLLLGKALTDEKYRAKLLDPATRADALKDVGVAKPTKTQLQALQNAITTLETLSGSFGPGQGAA